MPEKTTYHEQFIFSPKFLCSNWISAFYRNYHLSLYPAYTKIMGILYFLIGCSILVALVFLVAFFWAMSNGQNDDLQTPAIRMLFDDDSPEEDQNPVDLIKK